MTRITKTLLAFLVVAASLLVAAPRTAQACGGYGVQATPESQVQTVVARHVERAQNRALVSFDDVTVRGEWARVRVHVRSSTRDLSQVFWLRQGDDGDWRVARASRTSRRWTHRAS